MGPVTGGAPLSAGSLTARTVRFYIEPAMLDEVLAVIDEELLPRYRVMPHFVGLLVLLSDVGTRHELIGLSLWDGCLEESEAFARQLVDRLYEIRGTSGTVKSYGVVRFLGRGAELLSDPPREPQDTGAGPGSPWHPLPGYDCLCRVRIGRDAVHGQSCELPGHAEALAAASSGLAEALGVSAVTSDAFPKD